MSHGRAGRLRDPELRQLTMALGRIGRLLRQRRGDDLSWPLVSLLLNIARLQPATPQQLAEAEGVAAPSLTRTLHRLVELGLVTRGDHPVDGRMALVSLTAAGEAERSRLMRRREAWISAHLRCLSDDEVEALRVALPALERLSRLGSAQEDTDQR